MNVGVAVFFLLSGFLLYRPFAQARFEGRRRPATLLYAQRRALRIVPAYWVALVCVVLLVGRSGESATASPVFTPEGIITYFGFLQIYDSNTLLGGISAAWTLCVEVTFYALLPLWALLIARIPSRSPAGLHSLRARRAGRAVRHRCDLDERRRSQRGGHPRQHCWGSTSTRGSMCCRVFSTISRWAWRSPSLASPWPAKHGSRGRLA